MKLLSLLLIIAAASCDGYSVDNNKWLDKVLRKTNMSDKKIGKTLLPIQNGEQNKEVSYFDGLVLELDTFHRTGDTTTMFNGTHFFMDIHYGFRFLSATFKNVSINGTDISASFRIRENSIHFAFYLIRMGGCEIRLADLEVERLSKIDLGSASQEYSESDIEEFFGTNILSAINSYLDGERVDIEKNLQLLCHPHQKDLYSVPSYLAFVEHFFYER